MRYLTVRDVAKVLCVSSARVRQLIVSKRLRAQKFGKSWLVQPKALDSVRVRINGRPRKNPSDSVLKGSRPVSETVPATTMYPIDAPTIPVLVSSTPVEAASDEVQERAPEPSPTVEDPQ